MKNTAPLKKKAIEAAKKADWQTAIELNREILETEPSNINALNRLALAMMQQGEKNLAKKALQQVLDLDKHNKIAARNLKQINKRKKGQVARFSGDAAYIEEPGKAKVIELIRVTDKNILRELSVGQSCQLDPKKSLVSVNTVMPDSIYVGTLPSDISLRLIKLINRDNQYQCSIHSIESEEQRCKVHIKEVFVSKINQGVTSFPIKIETEYEDPEILSLERELKNESPIEILDEDTEEEQKEVKELGESNNPILDNRTRDDEEEEDWDN
jgi:hypothetical protein